MYEQDYIMRINREIIRTMVKLIFNKDMANPVYESDLLESEKKHLQESLTGQTDLGRINDLEKEILELVYNNEPFALEKALLFYSYLNEQTDEFLLSNNFSHEKIESALKNLASQYGIVDLVHLMSFS